MSYRAPAAEPGANGIRRRLRRLAGPGGVVAGIAIDHRDSLRVFLERQGRTDIGSARLEAIKQSLAIVLAPAATAIMLDAVLGRLAFETGAVPASIGLIMPLEAQGYETIGDGRLTTLLADFSPASALAYGADACKVLLPYRVDDEDSAARQDALVRDCARACHALGMPLVVEPIAYPWSNESAATFAETLPALMVGAVRRLQPLGVDLFKLPFPLAESATVDERTAVDACRALTAACAGTPWVLLGAGAAPDVFVAHVRSAGLGGASGFLAGRGIWGVAVGGEPEGVAELARTVSLPLFERCRAVAEQVARPLDR